MNKISSIWCFWNVEPTDFMSKKCPYYLEQKYIGKIIISLLIHQMIRNNITMIHVILCLHPVNNSNCPNHLHMLLKRCFETRWRDLASHFVSRFFSDPYLTMRDIFSLASFLPTTWHVSGFAVTMEMTRQPYGITVVTKCQTTT